DPEDVDCGRDRMAGRAQRDGKGIERARPDIAEHDADRGEREEGGTALMAQFAGVGRIGVRWRGCALAGRSFHRPTSLAKGETCGRRGPKPFNNQAARATRLPRRLVRDALSLTMS